MTAGEFPARSTRPLLALAAALAVVLLAYLTYAVPASWFPSSPVKQWGVRDLALLPQGTERVVVNNELVVKSTDASGQINVAVATDFRARDYPVIAWDAHNVPAGANVSFIWLTDYKPGKIFNVPVDVGADRLLPLVLAKNPDWIGRITRIGLAIRGSIEKPMAISGVAAKPSGAVGVLQDRAREWLYFERWQGASINTIVGGDDEQALPLPLLLALAIALAASAIVLRRRLRPALGMADLAATLAIMFAASWFVLDARWTWNLARQAQATLAQYGGKDWRGKHLAADDGVVFAFVEKARAEMPATPVRVFVAGGNDYIRGRAAYHLYPHNVYAEVHNDDLPTPDRLKPGDWMLVYPRHGMQFDPKAGKLRWDGGAPVSAQLKLRGEGALLFLIQ